MNSDQGFKSALAIAGVLMLLYVCYGLSQAPRRAKVRAQRIHTVNAAPGMVLVFKTNNAPAPVSTSPNTKN